MHITNTVLVDMILFAEVTALLKIFKINYTLVLIKYIDIYRYSINMR